MNTQLPPVPTLTKTHGIGNAIYEYIGAMHSDKEAAAWIALKGSIAEAMQSYATEYGEQCARAAVEALAKENSMLRNALQFYADKSHFGLSDESAWDTVSGEPSNFWCDEAGTATMEDGSVARAALAGRPLVDEPDDAATPPAVEARVPDRFVVTEEMHVAACKVLARANGLDGLPQRMVDAMLSAAPAAPQPSNELGDLIGCFDAAMSEGLNEALAETQDERLKDLVERRLMFGYWKAVGPSPAAPGPQAEPVSKVYPTAEALMADLLSDEPEPTESEQVCHEAYQVVGSLLADLGVFNTPQAEKILDNLSAAKMVHKDVLPWPSFEVRATQPPTQQAERWHVGDSDFESWYSGYNPANKGDKLRARDAYAAGMGEREPTQQASEQPSFWAPPERDGEYHAFDSETVYRTPKAGWVPLYRRAAPQQASAQPIPLNIIRKWPEGFHDRLQHVWLDVVSFIPDVKLYDLQRVLAEFGFRMEVYENASQQAVKDVLDWLHGWPRMGETGVLMGTQVCCVGCGKGQGLTTVALESGDTYPDRQPDWPFKEESCPVCKLQSRIFEAPEDKLTARLKALRNKGEPKE